MLIYNDTVKQKYLWVKTLSQIIIFKAGSTSHAPVITAAHTYGHTTVDGRFVVCEVDTKVGWAWTCFEVEEWVYDTVKCLLHLKILKHAAFSFAS